MQSKYFAYTLLSGEYPASLGDFSKNKEECGASARFYLRFLGRTAGVAAFKATACEFGRFLLDTGRELHFAELQYGVCVWITVDFTYHAPDEGFQGLRFLCRVPFPALEHKCGHKLAFWVAERRRL